MKRKQKSLRQIAREIGVSASYLSQIRHGQRPASDRLLSILDSEVLSTMLSNSALSLRHPCDNILARGVAQPGSAPEWGSGGRRFKSVHPDTQSVARRHQIPIQNFKSWRTVSVGNEHAQ